MESEPLTPDDIIVQILYAPIINGEISEKYNTQLNFEFEYALDRGRPRVALNFTKLCKKLEEDGIKEDMEVTITIAYVEK